MNQHHDQPKRAQEYQRGSHEGPGGPNRNEPDAVAQGSRGSPSVAPVAYQLEEEREDPAPTPPQAISTFGRNVIIATMVLTGAFIVLGIAWSSTPPWPGSSAAPAARGEVPALQVDKNEDHALEALVRESSGMSLPTAEAKRIAQRANALSRMSLSQPVEPIAAAEKAAPKQRASVPTEASLVDVAASAASLRCLDASELNPSLRVTVRFAPDGWVASVGFEGAEGYPPSTLACVEDVFGELRIAGYRGGERTVVRVLGGVE